jgi:uncharacterized protein YndB with AHSA1/START domain
MAMETKSESATADREISTTRLLDAPRSLVFEMWTDPNHIAQWWGPNGFTTTIHEMDVRPGGVWRFIMHGPDGTDYQNHIVYNEIIEPERITYTHTSGPHFDAIITFAEEAGKTRLSMRMIFETVELRDRVVEKYGAIEGQQQTINRLVEHLAKQVR